MKTLRRFWWLAGIGAIVIALATLLALPALAAPTGQFTDPPSDTHAAMHGACLAGDLEAMNHDMSGSHQGAMGSPMAGSSGMMGDWSTGGMMGGQSGQSMMGMGGMMGW